MEEVENFLKNFFYIIRTFMKYLQNGFLSALPFVGIIIFQFLAAISFDYLRGKNLCSVTVLRKIFNSCGTFSASIIVSLIGILPCDSVVENAILFTLSQAVMEFAWMGGFYFSIFEMAPLYTNILTALGNMSSYLAGFINTAVISWITTDVTREQWLAVFYLSAGVNTFGGVLYLIFGSSELQPWATDPTPPSNKNENAYELEPLQKSVTENKEEGYGQSQKGG